MDNLRLFALQDIPLIKMGDNLSDFILNSVQSSSIRALENNDIIVVSHTAVCKSKGYITNLNDIQSGEIAEKIANGSKLYGNLDEKMDPRHVQLILNNSRSIIRPYPHLITETLHGMICANSGVDKSNVERSDCYVYLPPHPDIDAKEIRVNLYNKIKKNIVVIIADSEGRPFRVGSVGVAVGVSGINPMLDYRGISDLYGYKLRHSKVCVVDELVSAAQLLLGEGNEGTPCILIRGYQPALFKDKIFYDDDLSKESFQTENNEQNTIAMSERSSQTCIRPPDTDLFRHLDGKNLLMSRFSFRKAYSKREIDKNSVMQALNLVRFAPSAHNYQPWEFYWIQTMEKRAKLIQTMGEKRRIDMKKDNLDEKNISKYIESSKVTFTNAPLFFIVSCNFKSMQKYPDSTRFNAEKLLFTQSVANSICYFLLALKFYGLDSCWYSAGAFASDVINKELNLPQYEESQAIICAGYSDLPIGEELLHERPMKKEIDNYLHIV
jgi:coenzyme F420-0:L-glutamate ligase/coenzyme F420-1:gamma-L-glutamate ligase